MRKKIISLLLAVSLCILACGCAKQQTENIYDKNDGTIVSSDNTESLTNENAAYLDIVINEATNIISELKNIDTQSAKKLLKNYSIYTYLDTDLVTAIATAYSETVSGASFGCAIVDLDGKLVAAYSASATKDKNFALEKMQQHSTMKPLSVYAPAIESGIINWSTLTEDSPYKVLTNSNGVKYDWPSNATGEYSYNNITTYTAIKESINTVAVKVLSDYGVNNSIAFLQKNFNLDLSYEQQKATIYGEDEVIGNIALGATMAGSTPIDMAGYYQIFANGGTYTAPTAIKQITDKSGNIVYKDEAPSTQVITAETSYIMNELLRGVAKAGGTGDDARIEGVEVAGKTGTGSAFSDNWFVGITPEYSCAVWHSHIGYTNLAAKVFSSIVTNSEVENTVFMTSPNVKKYIYCLDSGMLLGSGCTNAEMGYYLTDNPPKNCTLH